MTIVNSTHRTVTAHPWLHVRAAPSIQAAKLGHVLPGVKVLVFEEVSGVNADPLEWLMIGFQGGIGFVAKRWTSGFAFMAWPTEYPYVITQRFGVNPDNYRQFYGDDRGHQGIDFRALIGTRIFCVADGIVSMVYLNPLPRNLGGHNFGVHCRVRHPDGYETIYAHMQELSIELGDEVAAFHTLGLADNTGHSFGSHLHLHLKHNGRVIDPTPYVTSLIPEEPE